MERKNQLDHLCYRVETSMRDHRDRMHPTEERVSDVPESPGPSSSADHDAAVDASPDEASSPPAHAPAAAARRYAPGLVPSQRLKALLNDGVLS